MEGIDTRETVTWRGGPCGLFPDEDLVFRLTMREGNTGTRVYYVNDLGYPFTEFQLGIFKHLGNDMGSPMSEVPVMHRYIRTGEIHWNGDHIYAYDYSVTVEDLWETLENE